MKLRAMMALLGVIERIPPGAFNMRRWVTHEGSQHHKGVSLNHCGTQACWLGAAAVDPVAKDILGLRLKFHHGGSTQAWDIFWTGPNGEKAKGMHAGAKALGITYAEAADLFSPGPDVSEPKHLRARWQALMDKYARKMLSE